MDGIICTLLVLAALLPVLTFCVIVFFGKKYLPKEKSGWFAVLVMGTGFVFSLISMMMWGGRDADAGAIVWNVPWIPVDGEVGHLFLGAAIDSLTIAMMVMVTGISTLVHIYSIGYMKGDKRFERFFAYLSLFTFSMLGIVLANSIMQLFVFWELVGLTSYLLIGFWFEKRGPQLASKKAFVMNRVGDAGFLIGFGILFYKLGANVLLPAVEGVADGAGTSLSGMIGSLHQVLAAETKEAIAAGVLQAGEVYSLTTPPGWLTAAGIGLFFGAMGKSAQFPLHTWLPDAMEGPTPVSSIVHSATMVAAGVYLTGRIYPILTPDAHLFIATIGLITLVMAACMALVMTDIKRVLAYSTLSQLGYMILGLGVGSYTFALFHLFTHAFFKCCLFQCSGSVINSMHHEQDMTQYGGLKNKMPKTALAYGICTLAIAGASIPIVNFGLSGFYSKDGIIAGAFQYGDVLNHAGYLGDLFWLGPIIIAYVTPFYMARSFALTFLGKPRNQKLYDDCKEAPATMYVPQLVLAVMAVCAGWFFWRTMVQATEPAVATLLSADALDESHGMHSTHAWLLFGFGWILSLGAGLAMYTPGFKFADKLVKIPPFNLLHCWFKNKFYFDALYDTFLVAFSKFIAGVCSVFDKVIVDGLVNGAGTLARGVAYLVGQTDTHVVDGSVNGAASFVQTSGGLLSQSQSGRVRGYVTILIGTAVFTGMVVVAVVLVIGSK